MAWLVDRFGEDGRIKRLWNSPWVGVPLWITGAIYTIYWLFLVPPPGYAVGALAVVAGVMSVREIKILGKISWVVLLVCLLITEFRAINKDRVDNENKQKEFFALQKQGFSDIATQAGQNFATTTRGLNTAISGLNSVLGTTQNVAALAKQNLDTISGTGAVPCVIPEVWGGGMVDGKVPFIFWNKGKNDLTGVEIRILSEREFLDPKAEMEKPTITLGTVPPDWPKRIPDGIVPDMVGSPTSGVATYQAFIWAQNGFYIEVINFRRGKYSLPWAYQYWLTKQTPLRKPKRMSPKLTLPKGTMMPTLIKECKSTEWSDDLGEGKPITKTNP